MMAEKFSSGELTALRSELLQSGVDSWDAARVLQIFLAGRAVFVGPDWWQRHRDFVHMFEWLSPLSVILAYLGRATRGAKWLAWGTVVLLFLEYATAGWQSSLGKLGLAMFHPVIAALLFWTAVELARRARRPTPPPA